jgi:hypothetical protein
MSVIEFPGRGTSPEDRSEEEIHAEAFRDLEGHIGDCATMAKITSQFMANAQCTDETLAFSVFHLTEMLLNLKKHYEAAWRGEMPASRLITSPAKTTPGDQRSLRLASDRGQAMKRRRRTVGKRNRQRLASHNRRLRR